MPRVPSQENILRKYEIKKRQIQNKIISNMTNIVDGALKIIRDYKDNVEGIKAVDFKSAVHILEKWLPDFNKSIDLKDDEKDLDSMTVEEVDKELKELIDESK